MTIQSSFLILLLLTLILLVSTENVNSGAGSNKPNDHEVGKTDPYDSNDDMGLYSPYYDTNNPNNPTCRSPIPVDVLPIYKIDILLLQFAQNLEHFQADFFLWSALGYGLDVIAPWLAQGGPSPIGAQKANLDTLTSSIIREFGFEQIGHLRAMKTTVGGIPRPLIDLSPQAFATIVNRAFGYELKPPFDPYRDSLKYMLGAYIVPYVVLNGYVNSNILIKGYISKRLLAGLLGVKAGQDAVIRTYLYERAHIIVQPYNFTVAEYTNRISNSFNIQGMCGIKDEGIIVPPELGAEGNSSTNVLSANRDSLSYPRTPEEILRNVYGTGDERVPGGFYPKGANGKIARMYLNETSWN